MGCCRAPPDQPGLRCQDEELDEARKELRELETENTKLREALMQYKADFGPPIIPLNYGPPAGEAPRRGRALTIRITPGDIGDPDAMQKIEALIRFIVERPHLDVPDAAAEWVDAGAPS